MPAWPVPSVAMDGYLAYRRGGPMAKYVVTGGADGQSGIEVDGKRHEPGDTVEISNPKKDWRVEAGYLALASDHKATRARDDNGHYVADDPDTPEDEAYEQPTAKKAGGK